MGDLIVRAQEFEEKAENKLSGRTCSCFKEPDLEEAAQFLLKAVDCYKHAETWDKAGATYIKLAECLLKSNLVYEAANSYADSAGCYMQIAEQYNSMSNVEKAIEFFAKAGELFEKAHAIMPFNHYDHHVANCRRNIVDLYIRS